MLSVTKDTKLSDLMKAVIPDDGNIEPRDRSVWHDVRENGIILGQVKFRPSSDEWIRQQKEMKEKNNA